MTSLILLKPKSLVSAAQLVAPVFDGPLTITDALISSRGSNVFEGNWENTSYTADNGAAVYVQTTQPVIIQNSRFKGQKYCISSVNSGTNVTVRNCVGLVRNTTYANQPCQRFLNLFEPASVACENNTMVGGGILLSGGTTPMIRIRYNRALNIDGRLSDGANGYVFEAANTANVYFQAKQFVQLNSTRGVSDGDISWNEVINDPFVSRPEDSINLYGCAGVPGSPIKIHDNAIFGGMSSRPYDVFYSGGGIICDKGTGNGAWTDGATNATAWIDIDDNHLAGLVQHGISAPYANNINARRNRIICPRTIHGGVIKAANVGAYVGGALQASVNDYTYNVLWDDNVIGCVNAGGAQNNTSISAINSSGVASASAGAKTRITLTHGLTAAENGKLLPVWSGTNWTRGEYALTYVDATHLDVDVPWNASFGNPVIRSLTVDITNTTSVPFPTEYDAYAERAIWRAKVAAAGVTIGSTLAV